MIEEIRPDVKKLVCDSNIYMIFEENGDITLVDVSDNHHGNWVRQELEKVIDFSKVTTVLLTHLHYDHVGNLDFFPDAKVYASAEDLQDYRKNPGNFFLYDLSEKTKGMLNHAISYSEEIMGMKVMKNESFCLVGIHYLPTVLGGLILRILFPKRWTNLLEN
jgi:glyoxylase-like metal-dependent hydrolase (beta-lactamase superfamily II)